MTRFLGAVAEAAPHWFFTILMGLAIWTMCVLIPGADVGPLLDAEDKTWRATERR